MQDEIPRGSCQSESAEICLNGIWQTEDCTACSLLDPEQYCRHIRPIVLDPAADWAVIPGAVMSFSQTPDSMSATFNFTAAGQVGILQIRFTHSTGIAGVTIQRTPLENVDITLETADSLAGCQYSLDASGMADQTAGDGCWGEEFYAFIPGLYTGSPADLLNIRLAATAPGPATLTVEGIQLEL